MIELNNASFLQHVFPYKVTMYHKSTQDEGNTSRPIDEPVDDNDESRYNKRLKHHSYLALIF